MADRDLVGLLTGIPTQPIQVSSDPWQRLAQRSREGVKAGASGGRAVGKLFAKLTGREVPDNPMEQLEKLLPNMNPENPDDLTQLAKLQMSSGNQVGAARTIAQRNSILQAQELSLEKQELEDQEVADRISLSTYVQEKYPELPQLAMLVQSGVVTAKNLKDFLPDATEDVNAQFGGSDTWVDEEGNYFYGTQVKDPRTKTTSTSLSPVDPAGPTAPVGNVTPVSSTGETSAEKQARMIETSEAKEQSKTFVKNKAQAVGGIPALLDNKKNIEEAQKILETLPTGGPINIAAYGIEDFFGLTSGNRADFERVLAMEVYKSLKPIFGGVISEGERASLLEIAATVGRGNKANSAIIKRLIKDMNQRISQAKLYSDSENFDEYNAFVQELLKEDKEPKAEKTRVTWGDL